MRQQQLRDSLLGSGYFVLSGQICGGFTVFTNGSTRKLFVGEDGQVRAGPSFIGSASVSSAQVARMRRRHAA